MGGAGALSDLIVCYSLAITLRSACERRNERSGLRLAELSRAELNGTVTGLHGLD